MNLYPFQEKGVAFLDSHPHALLADEPGLGKSIQTLTSLAPNNHRVLILCPSSLKYSWRDEIIKWTPEVGPGSVTIAVIDGKRSDRERQWGAFKANMGPTYFIVNYEGMRADKEIIPKAWDAIVCDEATRIANTRSQTFKVLWALQSERRIALTGTPVQNSPLDIFGIISWLTRGALGNYWQFLNAYCVREPRFNRIVGYKNLDRLAERVKPIILRRLKSEVLTDLPPRTIQDVEIDLASNERALYDDVRAEIAAELVADKKNNLSLSVVKILRLKQLTDWPQLLVKKSFNYGEEVIKSSKFEALSDLLEPIKASDEKAIVFTQFAEVARALKEKLMNAFIIEGDTPSERRQEIVREFNERPGHDILIMTEAGAFGLNIQGASYIIHYDLPWSVGKYEQRIGRAHRIGQDKPVTVYNLIGKDTIDEYCLKVLRRKYKLSDAMLGDSDRLEDAGVSEEDIKAILNL